MWLSLQFKQLFANVIFSSTSLLYIAAASVLSCFIIFYFISGFLAFLILSSIVFGRFGKFQEFFDFLILAEVKRFRKWNMNLRTVWKWNMNFSFLEKLTWNTLENETKSETFLLPFQLFSTLSKIISCSSPTLVTIDRAFPRHRSINFHTSPSTLKREIK